MALTTAGLIPTWGDADQMFSLSNTLVTQAETFAKELANQQWFAPYTIGANYPTITAPPVPQLPGVPTLETVVWTTPSAPATFTTLPPNISGLFPSPFSGVSPILNFGSLPQPAYGSIPNAPPVDLNFNYPTPTITLPAAPTLLSLDTVSFDVQNIPLFDGVAPTLTLVSPNIIPFVEPPVYASGLLDDLTLSLQSALTDDTDTGLTASTQQAMWDAARQREMISLDDALNSLDRDMEELGYALPPGVWADERYKLQRNMHEQNSTLSRDIMVKQAEMHLDNVMKSREMAVSLEGKLIDYHNQIAQRVFETAKYETESAISIYNASVQIYAAQIQGFTATIQAYSAYIEGVKARIAQMQAQVEYEKTKAEIDSTLVEMYNGQIKAALAVLEVAKVQVEIIQVEASVEKTKVDIYSAQIQAFVATVNAYTAEVEGYKANAEAQSAIENVYKTQVEAYSAQVQAAAAQSGALVEGYKAQVQGYEAQLEAFKAQLQAMVEQARAVSEYNQSATAEYTAQVQALGTYNEVLVKEWQAILDEQLQIAQVQVKVSEANSQLAISERNISIEAIKGAATVLAQLGAAALGAIRWSNGSQWSLASNFNNSNTNSTSTSDEHIFSQSA